MLTNYLAKLLGLWAVVAVGAMLATRDATIAVIGALFADPALMWITGIFMLLVGLAILLVHNRWSGGAVPAIVTLIAWLVLIKGLLFVWLPPLLQTSFYQALHFDRYFYAYLVLPLAFGLYLIYAGFKERPTAI
ncbi:MAG TPA: hypothetical protein VGI19_17880 [Candidatus Cybelea sp.]